jgi:coenzyme F420-reducing hydrogenase alpha subunit
MGWANGRRGSHGALTHGADGLAETVRGKRRCRKEAIVNTRTLLSVGLAGVWALAGAGLVVTGGCEKSPREKEAERMKDEAKKDADRAKQDAEDQAALQKKQAELEKERKQREADAEKQRAKDDAERMKDGTPPATPPK